METLISILLGLGFFLAVIAVVGHLLYLVFAATLRGLFGDWQDRRVLCCPACRTELHVHAGKCIRCGVKLQIPDSLTRRDSAEEFERELRRLRNRGVIDDGEFKRLLTASRSDLESPWLTPEPIAKEETVAAAPQPVSRATPVPKPQEPERDAALRSVPPIERPAITQVSPVPKRAARTPAIAAELPSALLDASTRTERAPALAELLRAFMDENNIRWGELLSGLLIVGSGIGLVISLWATLQHTIPYFPALLFMLVTASIHGAGMYTLHRWNLKSTSRGLLIISQFLIPLNYLAAVALSDKRPADDTLFRIAMATGLVVFGSMCYFAGRRLLLAGWWLLPVGIMGPSAGQVLISRNAVPDLSAGHITLLFLLPLASFLVAALGQLAMVARWPRLTIRRAAQLLLVIGVTLFALLVSAGILLWRCDALWLTLAKLAPSLSVVAAVILATGGVVHRRLTAPGLATWRTAGTAIALSGGGLMLACLYLAWPRPEILVAVGLVNFAAMTALALVLELATLHVPALAALALAGLIGFHLGRGQIPVAAESSGTTLLAIVLRGQSGVVLAAMSAIAAAGAAVWRRFARTLDAAAWLGAAGGLATASLLVAAHAGFWSRADGDLATAIFAVYAIVLLIGERLIPDETANPSFTGARDIRVGLGWTASVLGLAALVHALAWNETVRTALDDRNWLPARPIAAALLLHATLLAALGFSHRRERRQFLTVCGHSAVLTSVLAAVIVLMSFDLLLAIRSEYTFWAAGVWLAAAVLYRSPGMLTAAQALATTALCMLTTSVCQRQTWWTGSLLGAKHVYVQMSVLAAWSALWVGTRRLLRPFTAAGFLRAAALVQVDRIILGALVAGLPVMAALACGPGVGSELKTIAPVVWSSPAGWLFVGVILAATAGIILTFATGGSRSLMPLLTRSQAPLRAPGSTVYLTAILLASLPLLAAFGVPAWSRMSESYWHAAADVSASGFGGMLPWITLVIVFLSLVGSMTEALSATALFGTLWLALSVPLLAAGPFDAQNATASALRWSFALFGMVVGLSAVPLGRIISRLSLRNVDAVAAEVESDRTGEPAQLPDHLSTPSYEQVALRNSSRVSTWLWDAALTLCLVPLLTLTLDTAIPVALEGMQTGPIAGSLFARLGAEWSLAGPLIILVAAFCGRALQERAPKLGVAASFAMQFAVAGFIAVSWTSRGVSITGPVAVQFLQWNGIALGGFSLAWLAVRRFGRHPGSGSDASASQLGHSPHPQPLSRGERGDAVGTLEGEIELFPPLTFHVSMTAIAALVLPVCAVVAVIVSPGFLPRIIDSIGARLSYAPLALAAVAVIQWLRVAGPDSGERRAQATDRWGIAAAAVSGLAAFGLGAASAAPGNTAENWVSYHILMAGWMAVVFLTTTACLAPSQFHAAFRLLTGGRADLDHSPSAPTLPSPPGRRAGGEGPGPEPLPLPLLRTPLPVEAGGRTATPASELAGSASLCTTAVGALVLFLAARGVFTDPARPYWGVATTAVLAVVATILGLWRRSQIYAYTSARLAALAASYAWTTPWLNLGLTPVPQSWIDLTEASAVAATLAGGFWLMIELWYERKLGMPFAPGFAYPPPHRGTSRLALIAACALALVALAARWLFTDETHPIPFAVSNPGGWLLIASLAAVLTGTLWDRRARRALPSLYVLGLATAAFIVDRCQVTERYVPYAVAIALAVDAILTSVLWAARDRFRILAARYTIPGPEAILERAAKWLPETTLFLALLVAGVEVWVVLTFEDLVLRLTGAGACALVTLGLPAFSRVEERRSFREVALLFAALAAIDFGWASMPADESPYFWLFRSVRLLVVLAATTFAYGGICARMLAPESDWFRPARRAATVVGGASLASLLVVLAHEADWFSQLGNAPLTGGQIALVAGVLVGLSAALVSLAVLPGRDPLELPESRRMLYVYAAEAVLALLFLHVYFAMPQLFHGYLLPYWPLIVIGIAYFGVGVGEICRRAKLRVLSEPLNRTGAFLPLLPALGFWVHASQTSHSTVLFIAGILYVLLSLWRKNFVYSFAAALAGNAGLWALWHEHGIRLAEHPQLWAIPPALSALVAVQINRERLTDEQVTGIRYLCVTLIYVSSTGEMFITGIAESLAMPTILAALSVIGAFAGIVLRVRAFLYLGSSFLLLSIVSMVWHAARNINHVWPWWAFGIGLGLTILTVLGIFEKKRKEVQLLLDEFRQWER